MISPTQTLSECVAKLKFEDIPELVREYAKDLILDSIGCSIGGIRLQPGKIMVDYFTELGGAPQSSILATGQKLPCMNAAYVNSYLTGLLDFDDVPSVTEGHPGATIIPPGLALAEKIQANGKDFMTAVVTAYEAWTRISQSINGTPERRAKVKGFATHQIFSTVIAASKLLKLNAEQTAMAMGIAGVSAPVPSNLKMGLQDRPVSWTKNNYGWASMGGILSALLTDRGFIGNQHIFDGDTGFWLMAGSDRCDLDKLTLNFGRDFLISTTGFKPYASCRYTHSSIDATMAIMAKHKVDINKIKSIRVKTFAVAVSGLGMTNPTSIFDAQFSIPHMIALELLGKSAAKGLAENNLTDPRVQSIAGKVSLEISPPIEERYLRNKAFCSALVSIEQTDGSVFSGQADVPKWDPETRPTRNELQTKFAYLTESIIGTNASRAMMRDVEQLENLKDVSSIMSRLNNASNP